MKSLFLLSGHVDRRIGEAGADWEGWHAYTSAPSVAQSVQLSVTLWAVAHQALLSTRFSRQEHWRGLPFPTLEDLPDPGIKAVSCTAGRFFTIRTTKETRIHTLVHDVTTAVPVTHRTVAHQAPLFVGFSRQENWSGSPGPPLGIFLTQGSKPPLFMSPALVHGFITTSAT